MSEVKVHYECAKHFEALVFSAALQSLEDFKLPTERNDRSLYHEHPERRPLTERSLRQPSGIKFKGSTGAFQRLSDPLHFYLLSVTQ
jgi:hypothetical protein